ncbi:aminotransferase class V-fold PLP-dependent enzyme [Psychrobium sp. 1_MG-2023]|uniref:aminotransferase class V-fold PLP-dependent enzyme n=1 Tax=Psychrobium sp. 1_MG-2023 TaxID=3062624 RepID=UPI000C3219C1|nr:cysteine desulfurase [Psychrobium sp. 1_MG-2023]MDP2562284.1 cysteine desulfurase [Psychrobium sp. 1_MG-2023]PKF54667.1 cysteine desulfurase CsdA [Alteromonadales bacterium alter-6D02]
MTFDAHQFRQQFPLICDSDQIYLDSAATAQKPQCVIDCINKFYSESNANVHRAAHQLSAKATAQYELARSNVAKFIHAHNSKEVIFTKGTTESINLIAQSYARPNLAAIHNIVVAVSEHHANIVPWQMVCQQTGAELRVIHLNDNYELDLNHALSLIDQDTKIVAIAHASNVTGVINPIEELISLAKNVNAVTVIDGAQAIAHLPVDVQQLDCDFYVFSAHKMFGPTGVGILYGKEALLEAMPPWQGGGEMIKKVSFSGTTYNQLPFKFEAGTPNISGVLGLSQAINFIQQFEHKQVFDYEQQLLNYATERLKQLEEVNIIGDVNHKLPVLSFVVDEEHSSDVATLLDQQNIAVRAGHHCAMPLMEYIEHSGTIRASFAPYNTFDEVEEFTKAVEKTLSFF